jgi:hypothetical protein
MAFRADSVMVAGHLAAAEMGPPTGPMLLDALLRLERDKHGMITIGRIARLGANPDLQPAIDCCLQSLHGMYEHGLPLESELLTVEEYQVDCPSAKAFRAALEQPIDPTSELPVGLRRMCSEFAAGETVYGALHLQGFDVDGEGAAATALALAHCIGEPYAEAHETDQIVQTITPHPEESVQQTSGSYDVALEAHVENVGQERVPDYIVLVCERNLEGAETWVISPVEALWDMRRRGLYREEALLWQAGFWVRRPFSFGLQEYQQGHRVVQGNIMQPSIYADFADVGSDNPELAAAYRHFEEACAAWAQPVRLAAGDALLLRNTGPSLLAPCAVQVMHGRGPYRPDPVTPRTLHRVYVKERSILDSTLKEVLFELFYAF